MSIPQMGVCPAPRPDLNLNVLPLAPGEAHEREQAADGHVGVHPHPGADKPALQDDAADISQRQAHAQLLQQLAAAMEAKVDQKAHKLPCYARDARNVANS